MKSTERKQPCPRPTLRQVERDFVGDVLRRTVGELLIGRPIGTKSIARETDCPLAGESLSGMFDDFYLNR